LPVESFDTIWNILEASHTEGCEPGIVVRRLSPDIPHDIFLGVEKPGNKRMLLLRMNKKSAQEFQHLPSFKGFDVSGIQIPEDQEQFRTFGLVLKDPLFKDIFTTLTEDIVNYACPEKSGEVFLRKIKSRLELWQHFLDQYGDQGLNAESQRGLYGELRFLRDFLIPLAGPARACDAWKGPFRSHQDFQFSGIAVEVKTSIAKQHQKITITSEQQLDSSGLEDLYIFHLSIREINDGGVTLPLIIDELLNLILLQGGPVAEFENHLFRAGYLDKHREKYLRTGYVDRSVNIFHVRDDFPRIIEKELRNGVGDVQYTIDVSACIPFRDDEEKFRSVLGRIFNAQ
jgi:hypothetical protein